MRFEDIRAGGYDPAARLDEMDRDGVDAEVLYPTPRLSAAIIANQDAEYHLAMVKAYNDWISEFVAHAPDALRRPGDPARTAAVSSESVAEIDRVLDRPGMRGVVMGCYPNGTLSIEPEDDQVWGALAERGVPLGIHVSLTQRMPAAHRSHLPGYGRFFDAPEPHDRVGDGRRVRSLPAAERGVRGGRLRLGAVREGADRQQLPPPRSGEPLRSAPSCRASTSPSTSTTAT